MKNIEKCERFVFALFFKSICFGWLVGVTVGMATCSTYEILESACVIPTFIVSEISAFIRADGRTCKHSQIDPDINPD